MTWKPNLSSGEEVLVCLAVQGDHVLPRNRRNLSQSKGAVGFPSSVSSAFILEVLAAGNTAVLPPDLNWEILGEAQKVSCYFSRTL